MAEGFQQSLHISGRSSHPREHLGFSVSSVWEEQLWEEKGDTVKAVTPAPFRAVQAQQGPPEPPPLGPAPALIPAPVP